MRTWTSFFQYEIQKILPLWPVKLDIYALEPNQTCWSAFHKQCVRSPQSVYMMVQPWLIFSNQGNLCEPLGIIYRKCDNEMMGALMPCNHQEADTWYHDASSSQTCIWKYTSKSNDQDCRYWCCNFGHFYLLLMTQPYQNCGYLSEQRKVISIYLFISWVYTARPGHKSYIATVLRIYRVWFYQPIIWHRKENCLENLEGLPRPNWNTAAINKDPNSFSIESEHMAIYLRCVVLLYSESCPATRTNQARKAFSKTKRALDILLQHKLPYLSTPKNLYYRHFSIHIHMGDVLQRQQTIPSCTVWGWVITEKKRAGPFLDIPLRC